MNRNVKTPLINYTLKIINMDARNATATIKSMDDEGIVVLSSKSGYLVDMVHYLEDMGVDRYELTLGLENMEKFEHDTAIFNSAGVFAKSAYHGILQ